MFGLSGGNVVQAGAQDSPWISHSARVSGRWKLKTSRERGLGSRPSVKRVMMPVLS